MVIRQKSFLVIFIFSLFLSPPLLLAQAKNSFRIDQKTPVKIIIPKNPAPSVKFAAEELKHYLNLMTGLDFEISNKTDSATQNYIFLGDSVFSRKANITVKDLPRDGFIIRSIGKNLYIVGKDSKEKNAQKIFELKGDPNKNDKNREFYRPYNWDFELSTAYGTWYFLRTIGVRWLFPGPQGEIVPQKKEIVFNNDINITKSPHFEVRMLGDYYWPQKGFTNNSREVFPDERKVFQWNANENFLWKLRMGCGSSKFMAINHRPPRHFWRKRFAKKHPEYFAILKDGRRDLPENLDDKRYWSHLCYTSPGVFNETLKDINAYFGGWPSTSRDIPYDSRFKDNRGWNPHASYKDTFSLLPHDGYRGCFCENCRKLHNNEQGWDYFISDLVFDFVKRVAEGIKKKFPNKYITCLAYGCYSYPPRNFEKFPDNVLIGLCPHRLARVYNTVNKEDFNKLMALFELWSSHAKLFYWMHMLYRWNKPDRACVPMLIPHHIGSLIEGISGYTDKIKIEFDRNSVAYENLNRYVFHEKLWDPKRNTDEIIDDYILNLYGPTAFEKMKRLLSDIENTCNEIAKSNASQLDIYQKYFTLEKIKKYKELISQIKQQTKGTQYHAKAVLFSKYFIGGIEKGYNEFRAIQARARHSNKIVINKVEGEIKVDGILDDKAWDASRVCTFVNNIDGKKLSLDTKARLLYTDETLYFSFDCAAPDLQRQQKEKKYDYVEIFLDDNYDKDSFYQILVYNNGKILDFYHDGGGERPNSAWSSGAKAAIKKYDNRWTVEIAVPRNNLSKIPFNPERPWGLNLCRTMSLVQTKERFSSISRLLFGGFAQPGMFCQMYFNTGKNDLKNISEVNLIKNGSLENWNYKRITKSNYASPRPENWYGRCWGKSKVLQEKKIVHSGKYSVKFEQAEDMKPAVLSQKLKETDFSVNGKYKISFFWYSESGEIAFDFSFANDGKSRYRFYPNKKIWKKSGSSYHYEKISGKVNTWNKYEAAFTLDFPRKSGDLIFNVYDGKKIIDQKGTCCFYVDDVSIIPVQ